VKNTRKFVQFVRTSTSSTLQLHADTQITVGSDTALNLHMHTFLDYGTCGIKMMTRF